MKDLWQPALNKHFGFENLRAGQQEVIEAILNDHSALAVFPTGGGKSLCYQLPAILLEGLTLVVSPLIALMKDQVESLQKRGIAAERIDSTRSAEEVAAITASMREGKLKLLYVAPERLSNERFKTLLKKTPLALIAIDEAHCISEWGHNFRPDYMKLANLVQELSIPRVIALTATATPQVALNICSVFNIEASHHFQTGFHRANLTLKVTPCAKSDKNEALLSILPRDQSSISYVTQQFTAESVARFLKEQGYAVRAYHAGMNADTRTEVQNQFMNGEIKAVVATIAFGMGIDKSDIRTVVHYNLPKSLENYTQEIGRAGRDGEASHCELLACEDDLTILANFHFGDTPSQDALHSFVQHLLRQPDEFHLSLYDLGVIFDIRQLVTSTILTYLELDGYIEATRPFYDRYQVRFLKEQERILHGYAPEQKGFLKRLFAQGKEARSWTTFETCLIADEINVDRDRIARAFQHLESMDEVQLKVSKIQKGYRFLKRPAKAKELIASLHQRFSEREKRDSARLDQVRDYTLSSTCLTQGLLQYFGERLTETCQHCSVCAGQLPPPALPSERSDHISLEQLAKIQQLISERHSSLRTPRQLSRFLCGLSSPATTRARLTRDDRFGMLAEASFQTVDATTQTLILT